jgi:hypothetical protein
MSAKQNIYMVEFTVPPYPSQEFFDLIPIHRKKVHELMFKDVIISYTVAQERHKVWAILKAHSEGELVHYIEQLPLTQYLDYQYHEVMFTEMMPFKMNFSMN